MINSQIYPSKVSVELLHFQTFSNVQTTIDRDLSRHLKLTRRLQSEIWVCHSFVY